MTFHAFILYFIEYVHFGISVCRNMYSYSFRKIRENKTDRKQKKMKNKFFIFNCLYDNNIQHILHKFLNWIQ